MLCYHSVCSVSVCIPFHFFIFFTIVERDFWTFVSVSDTVNARSVPCLTETDKIMHPQHFGIDPTDVRYGFESHITFVSNFGIGREAVRVLLFFYIMCQNHYYLLLSVETIQT